MIWEYGKLHIPTITGPSEYPGKSLDMMLQCLLSLTVVVCTSLIYKKKHSHVLHEWPASVRKDKNGATSQWKSKNHQSKHYMVVQQVIMKSQSGQTWMIRKDTFPLPRIPCHTINLKISLEFGSWKMPQQLKPRSWKQRATGNRGVRFLDFEKI